MPTPSTALSRPTIAGSLMEYDLQASLAGFIGLKVFPVFEANEAAAAFGRIKLESLLKARDTARAAGASYNEAEYEFTNDTYTTQDHGFVVPVDDRRARMYRSYFDAEQHAAARARDVVLRNFEKRVAAAVFNTTIWTGASLTTATAGIWSTLSSGVPVTDVQLAINKVEDASGLRPNAVIMAAKTFRTARQTAQVIDRVKYSGHTDPKNITVQALAALFDVDYVLVAGGMKDTADEGQTASLSRIWDHTMCMVCRVATSSDIEEPCIGRTFHWGEDGSSIGSVVESWREEKRRSTMIRARMDTDEKRLYVQAGHLITGVHA